MMKNFTLLLIFLCCSLCLAQVGINTETPKATLDIIAQSATAPQNNEGILIPRMDVFPTTNPTADQDGMLVFITGNRTPTKGLYYWDNTATTWQTVNDAKKIDDLQDGKNDDSSIFLGIGAGRLDNGTDNRNIGIGYQALGSNRNGYGNIANGYRTLYNNSGGHGNITNGDRTLYSNTTGNNNIANGSIVLYNNTTGNNNIANGAYSLYSNTNGDNNIANGAYALYSNTNGNNNIANGLNTLYSNTEGDNNIANGDQALYNSTTGNNNIANGFQALYSNTEGIRNIANGYQALLYNTTGNNNIANGAYALYNNTGGDSNIANGENTLYKNTTGTSNVAYGTVALFNNTTGNNNTAHGYRALYSLTSGNNNIGIGYNAQVPSATGSNQIRMGNTSISYAGVQVGWSISSDRRFKENIQSNMPGINLVKALQPKTYTRKNQEQPKVEYGFIAQEIEETLKSLGLDNTGIITVADDGMYSVRYNDFIPVLTQAIKEQQTEIEELKTLDQRKQREIDELKTLVQQLIDAQND